MLRKALVGAGLLWRSGCPAIADDVTVRLLHVNQTGDPFWKQVAEDYNESHPGVKVVVDYMENEAYKAKLPTLLQSDDRPDIIYSWAGGVMRAQIEAGYIKDISANKADFEKTIYPAPLNAYVVDGKLYGIPIQLSDVLLIYNKDAGRQGRGRSGLDEDLGGFLAAVTEDKGRRHHPARSWAAATNGRCTSSGPTC